LASFSPSNKIGEGGFGSVFHGMIHGAEVAVKVMSQDRRDGVDMRIFETEIKVCCDGFKAIQCEQTVFDGTSTPKIGSLAWILHRRRPSIYGL